MRDRRGKLESDPFEYRMGSNGTMRVSRGGRVVTVLGRKDADKLLARIRNAAPDAVQQALSRATGHYKHGND